MIPAIGSLVMGAFAAILFAITASLGERRPAGGGTGQIE
jgi:hypothetical protein